MSQEPPERPGTARFAAALGVRRNAAVGFALGALVAVFLTYGAVTGPQDAYSDAAYVALGFVLAVGTGLLATLLLTVVSAVRLARET
ncbi:DUF7536 family protein [Halosegnis marinus]|uniref:Uncharacterized protein n=2 Tax=Halosegnis marinus TaxID=3034023 RepID=A0ABD5ZNH3_9EURY|nr:hypothetical protein [Halosegnis sp. DT85]